MQIIDKSKLRNGVTRYIAASDIIYHENIPYMLPISVMQRLWRIENDMNIFRSIHYKMRP